VRRIFVVFSVFVIAVIGLSLYFKAKPATVNGQATASEVSITTQESLGPQPTRTVFTPIEPTTTVVPITPTVGATETPEVQTDIVIEPTLDPLLLVDIETLTVNVQPQAIAFHPVLKQIVQVLDYQEGAKVSATVLDTNLEDVPEVESLGPPCTPGQSSWLTGYDWLTHPTHTAVDIACTDMRVGAAAKGKVYAILWQAEAYSYGSSGKNVLTISKIPGSWADQYGMAGWLIFGSGHMKVDVPVTVGQSVNGGDVLGDIGMTGNADGPHNHYYVVWLKTDGTTEFLDPNNWNALGTR